MVLLGVALVCTSLLAAVVIHSVTSWRPPATAFRGSSITHDSIRVEVVETAPEGLDNPNIRDTPDVWLELVKNASHSFDMEIYTTYKTPAARLPTFTMRFTMLRRAASG